MRHGLASKLKRAISRTALIVVVVVIIVIIAAGGFYALTQIKTTSTTTSSVTSSSTSSSTSVSSTSSKITTLTMDDAFWPSVVDLNMLDAWEGLPFPVWGQYSVYQTLVNINISAEYHSETYQFLPGLALNWTVSPNGTVYTFNLRQGVKFSNGDPFNSYEVWTEMYQDYYQNANGSNWLFGNSIFNMSTVDIGASTFSAIGTMGLSNPTGSVLAMMENQSWPIYVTGPYTIVFHQDGPYAYLLGNLVGMPGYIYDMQYVLDNGGVGSAGTIPPNSYFNQHPIPGTGPYTISQVSEMAYVEFTQNPTYWGANLTAAQIAENPLLSPGNVQNIIINYKTDDTSRYSDLSTGAADVAIIENNFNLIQANPTKYAYATLPPWNGAVFALAMNTQRYPTNITDIRLAIAHAINYSAIISSVFDGDLYPMVGPETQAWSQYYDPGNYSDYSYNVTLAEQYLNASGVNVATLPTLQFTQPSGCAYCNNADQLILGYLSAIGINVNIVIQSYDLYETPYSEPLSQRAQSAGQLSLLGGENYAPDILAGSDPWVTFVTADGDGNWAVYNNSVVNNAVSSFYTSNNQTYILSQLAIAQKQVYDDAPYAWIGTLGLMEGSGSLAYNSQIISGFYTDPMWSGTNTMPVLNTITFVNGQ